MIQILIIVLIILLIIFIVSLYIPKTHYQTYDPIQQDQSNIPNEFFNELQSNGSLKSPLTFTSNSNYKINLVNQCPVTVLAAALGPTPIQPENGKSWVLKPGEQLSLNIPKEWESTQGNSTVNGPRFWARTGCSYDIGQDKASCEAGDCGNRYDCSAANEGGSPPGSWAEFCFNCGDGLTYYDISLVDGAHMSMDIKPVNPSVQADNPFWCKSGLCQSGRDLRDPSICPPEFRLLNTQLANYDPNRPETTVACFSNCGKWAYLRGKLGDVCDKQDLDYKRLDHKPLDPETRNICDNWKKYCCISPSSGQQCKSDADCQFSEACWNGKCECRAFYKKQCDPNVCTHPYCDCESNCHPSMCPQGFSTQPKPQLCTSEQGCVGDDTFHQVCPQAYTWPNDPQTYSCDAKEYTIIFCPGGTPIEMSDSTSGIPSCRSFDQQGYNYQQARQDCSIPIQKGHRLACAKKNGPWPCLTDPNTSCYGTGALCEFDS